MLIESLFETTPARRKFLASPEAEARAVAAVVTKAALSNPSVAFTLRSNGRETMDAPAAVDRGSRILQVFGRATLGELETFEARSGALRVAGYATRGSVTFPTRRYQYLFVNGRPVEDRALAKAISQASRDAIRIDRHPAVFLYLTAEPGAVDVNVSPAKTQVRFADSATAFRLVYHALNSALARGQGGTEAPVRPERRRRGRKLRRRTGTPSPSPPGAPVGVPTPPPEAPNDTAPPAGAVPPPQEARRPPDIQPIGQHRESFILASGEEGLLIIDQHAAHERTLYERIRDRIASGRMLSQRLLLRVLFEATPEEVETLAARFADLSAAGFEIEPMSGRSYAIAALPAEATDRDPAETLRMALASLADAGSADEPLRRDKLAASIACRSAVTIRYHLAPGGDPASDLRLVADPGPLHLPARAAGGPLHERGRAREVLQAALKRRPPRAATTRWRRGRGLSPPLNRRNEWIDGNSSRAWERRRRRWRGQRAREQPPRPGTSRA